MATKLIQEYRRNDQRRYIYQPYWISSAEIDHAAFPNDESECALLFSFPKAKYGTSIIYILQVGVQITEAWAGGTITLDLGRYSLLTDAVTQGGVMTIVDYDDLVPTADITSGTAAYYPALTGDWITAALLMTMGADVTITPADATVPCVGLYVTTDSTTTAGKARAHMLITEVPLV